MLEVENIECTRLPPKPTINNLLRHSRSEENIVDGDNKPISSSTTEIGGIIFQAGPSCSASNLPTVINNSMDLHIGSDCWSQEDDEISLQV